MASSFSPKIQIRNNNSVKVKAYASVLNDTNASQSIDIAANSSVDMTLTTTQYKGKIQVYCGASGYDNSTASEISYEYNPLDGCTASLGAGWIETGTNIWEWRLTNNSNYNLEIDSMQGFSGTLGGRPITTDMFAGGLQTIDIGRGQTKTVLKFEVYTPDTTTDYDVVINADWVLDSSVKTSTKRFKRG